MLRRVAAAVLTVGVAGTIALKVTADRPEAPQASISSFSFSSASPDSPQFPSPEMVVISEPSTGEDAIQAALGARVRRDARTGWALLDQEARKRYPVVAMWEAAQADLPPPTAFEVLSKVRASTYVDVTLLVRRLPVVDHALGFIPARATEVWRASQEQGRWRVGDAPQSSTPQIPAATGAAPAVARWLDAVGSDPTAAAAEENSGVLLGPRDLLEAPAKEPGRWKVIGPVQGLDSGVAEVGALVAAFGSDVDVFVRLVPVAGPSGRGYVAVVPLENRWFVAGLLSPEGLGDSSPASSP